MGGGEGGGGEGEGEEDEGGDVGAEGGSVVGAYVMKSEGGRRMERRRGCWLGRGGLMLAG